MLAEQFPAAGPRNGGIVKPMPVAGLRSSDQRQETGLRSCRGGRRLECWQNNSLPRTPQRRNCEANAGGRSPLVEPRQETGLRSCAEAGDQCWQNNSLPRTPQRRNCEANAGGRSPLVRTSVRRPVCGPARRPATSVGGTIPCRGPRNGGIVKPMPVAGLRSSNRRQNTGLRPAGAASRGRCGRWPTSEHEEAHDPDGEADQHDRQQGRRCRRR